MKSLFSLLELEHALIDNINSYDFSIRFFKDKIRECDNIGIMCEAYYDDLLHYSRKLEEATAKRTMECRRLKAVREEMGKYFKELVQEAET